MLKNNELTIFLYIDFYDNKSVKTNVTRISEGVFYEIWT